MGLVGLAAWTCLSAAQAETVEDFYKGKTITLIVSTTAGSSYDLMGRTIAKHIGRYIPGGPNVIVRNMPGAGGITAANSLFRTAPKDGTTIAGLQGSVPFEPLLGTKEADFDAARLNWLGSPSTETCVFTIWGQAAVKTVEQAKGQEVTVGSSGVNANPSFSARLLNQVLGTKLRLIYGYPGQPDVFLAMEKGEVDAHPCVFWSALVSTRPAWLAEKKVNLLLQYGPAKEADLPNVPFLADLVTKPEDKLLLDAAFAPLALGRPYVMPPDVPEDRVAALRKAMDEVFRDAGFLAEAKQVNLAVNLPRTGAEIQELVRRTYAMPPSIIERLRNLSNQ